MDGMSSYFDLQGLIAAEVDVVHLMVGIICISTAFVFDKGEAIGI